jgi:hypothetical protein
VLILIVAGGPDKGRIYELTEDQPVVIGREGDQIKLSDRKASRKHTRLWAEGGKWYAQDLHSRHGTHLNAHPIENKTELADGDHLQIGKTLFVLARMPVEQAERLALLGDAAGQHAATAPFSDTYRPAGRRLYVAGGALAAAMIIGVNVAFYFASVNTAADLKREIEATRLASQQSSQALIEQVQVAARPHAAEPDPMLGEILAAVQAQREQSQLLQQISDAVAKLPSTAEAIETIAARIDEQPQHAAMLQGILAKLEEQPAIDALVAEVRAMASAARQQQEQLVARTQASDDLLRQTLAEVKAAPATDAEQLAAVVRTAIQSVDEGNGELLARVLANLEEQATLATEVRELRQIVERQPAATRAVVAEIVAAMPGDDASAVIAAIDELRKALPSDATAKLDQVLARLDEAAGPEQIAAAVKNVVTPPTAAQLAEAVEAVVARQSQPLAQAIAAQGEAQTARLDTLSARLEAQATRDELLAALDRAAAEPDARLVERIEALAGQLLDRARDGQADARLAATQELLGQVLAEVRDREAIEQVRGELQQLAQATEAARVALADGATDPAERAVLDEILAAVRDRGDTEARLSEIRDILKAWPSETEAMLKQTLAAIELQPAGEFDPAMDGVLREIRAKAIARIDELNAALRHDLRSELAQVSTQVSPRTAAAPQPAARSVLAQRGGQSLSAPAPEQALTQVEQAYKIAFETGQPVTIGAGIVNAATGEVSEGRTLDPAAAQAAGIKHWRQWYLMDDFAERMRLSKQQMRHRDTDRESVITLPSNRDVTVNAMPQPAGDVTVERDR